MFKALIRGLTPAIELKFSALPHDTCRTLSCAANELNFRIQYTISLWLIEILDRAQSSCTFQVK